MSIVSSHRNFETYCQQYPMLTAEEEHQLAIEYRDTQNVNAAERLVMSHMRLVFSAARKYSSTGIPVPDLVQQGSIGLMRAVQMFDPTHNLRLTTYAVYRITEAISDYVIRNLNIIKIATTKQQRKLFFNLRSIKNGRPLTSAVAREISEQLDVPLSDVYEMNDRLSQHDLCIDQRMSDDSGESVVDYLESNSLTPEEHAVEVEDYNKAHVFLPECIDKLDARSGDIIRRRWLDDTPATLKELALDYGVSLERIRQIEVKALATLRQMIQ